MMEGNTSKPEDTDNAEQQCVNDEEEWGMFYFWTMFFGPLFLILLGTFGNTIAYLVLRRKAYKKNVMAFTLRYLAILDNIILWTFVFKQFLVETGLVTYDVTQIVYGACALWSFYLVTITSIDSWLLVIITTSRLMHISCPFKVHSVCSKFNYAVSLVIMHIIVITLHSGIHFIHYLNMPANEFMDRSCLLVIARIEKKLTYLRVITLIVNFAGPFVLLLILNALIMRGLKIVESQEEYLHHNATKPTNISTTGVTQDSSHNALPAIESATTMGIAQFVADEVGDTRKKRLVYNIRDHQLLTKHSQRFLLNLQSYRNPAKALISTEYHGRYLGIQTPAINIKQSYKQNKVKEEYTTTYNKNNNTRLYNQRDSAVDRIALALPRENLEDTPVDDMTELNRMSAGAQNEQRTRRESLTSSHATTISHKSNKSKASGLSELITRAMAEPISFDVKPLEEDKDRKTDYTSVETSHAPGEVKQKSKIKDDRHKRTASLTRLLVTASLIFLILNIPFWIQFHFFSETLSGRNVGCYFRKTVVKTLLLIKFSNHAVNFFLYCATGSRFRQEFTDMMKTISIFRLM